MLERRSTLYLTTLRKPDSIEQRLNGNADQVVVKDVVENETMDNELIREITGTRGFSTSSKNEDEMLDTVYGNIEKVNQRMNVILDPVNPLEEAGNKDTYCEVLNRFKSKMLETGGLGVLHCITLDGSPSLRDVTLAISDVVIELELVSGTNRQQYQLTIPKNRGGTPMLEETEIKFGKDVWIDDTRNI